MIELYTAATPNGWKVSIALEELGLAYRVLPVRLLTGAQKRPGFLAINPNGRIPAIRDLDIETEAGPLCVFESGAILVHLAEKAGRGLPEDPRARLQALQWLAFQMSELGPWMGQANFFTRFHPLELPACIEHYRGMALESLGALDRRLGEVEFLAGGEHSIADVANFGWAHTASKVDLPTSDLVHLNRWLEALAARPAYRRGLAVPRGVDRHLVPMGEALIRARRALARLTGRKAEAATD